jgi:hypothetical protein
MKAARSACQGGAIHNPPFWGRVQRRDKDNLTAQVKVPINSKRDPLFYLEQDN